MSILKHILRVPTIGVWMIQLILLTVFITLILKYIYYSIAILQYVCLSPYSIIKIKEALSSINGIINHCIMLKYVNQCYY